jgi:hypothetical protein
MPPARVRRLPPPGRDGRPAGSVSLAGPAVGRHESDPAGGVPGGTHPMTSPAGREVPRQDACPECGRSRSQWRENNGRGCRGDDGTTYCSQWCAGRLESPAAGRPR